MQSATKHELPQFVLFHEEVVRSSYGRDSIAQTLVAGTLELFKGTPKGLVTQARVASQ